MQTILKLRINSDDLYYKQLREVIPPKIGEIVNDGLLDENIFESSSDDLLCIGCKVKCVDCEEESDIYYIGFEEKLIQSLTEDVFSMYATKHGWLKENPIN